MIFSSIDYKNCLYYRHRSFYSSFSLPIPAPYSLPCPHSLLHDYIPNLINCPCPFPNSSIEHLRLLLSPYPSCFQLVHSLIFVLLCYCLLLSTICYYPLLSAISSFHLLFLFQSPYLWPFISSFAIDQALEKHFCLCFFFSLILLLNAESFKSLFRTRSSVFTNTFMMKIYIQRIARNSVKRSDFFSFLYFLSFKGFSSLVLF